MRKLFLVIIWMVLALPAGSATIKFFTDYPNTVPVDSDFFVLQRNQSYINASQGQVRGSWFTSPTFTGNGVIAGSFTIGGDAIINGIVYGNGAGLTNIGSFNFIRNLNDFGTNETFLNTTFLGVSMFQEIDAGLFYPTNMFTFLTNAPFLKTDGDGKLAFGVELPGTNVLLSAGANIVFATNGSGGITISSSGTNTVDTSTNNTSVSTNSIVYGNLKLPYLTASKLLATDGVKNVTNADVTTDLSFSGNVLGIAAGTKPTINLYNSTNLNISAIVSPTNGVSSASAVDFSVPEATTNIAGAVSFTSLSNFNQTNYNHAIRWCINRTGSDQTITTGAWETDSGRQTATTYICTNNTTLGLLFGCQINFFTNVTSCKTFR